MVFYHCASMAFDHYPQLIIIMDKLEFIHYAFLLITGFLCGYYYWPKSLLEPKKAHTRLLKRSLKIALIFFFFNFLLYSTGFIFDIDKLVPIMQTPSGIIKNLILNVNGSLFAVEILLYIAFFLFLSSFLVGRINNYILVGLTAFVSILSVCSNTFYMIGFGLIGQIIGRLSQIKKFDWLINYNSRYPWLLVTFFVIFLITKFSGPSIHKSMRPISHLFYTIESFLWFICAYNIIHYLNIKQITNTFILIGRHTLLAYISQMVIIRFIFVFYYKADSTMYHSYLESIVFSSVSLLIFLHLFLYLTQRVNFIKRFYSLVFL